MDNQKQLRYHGVLVSGISNKTQRKYNRLDIYFLDIHQKWVKLKSTFLSDDELTLLGYGLDHRSR